MFPNFAAGKRLGSGNVSHASMTIEERFSTAIHEAGHAVVSWLLGCGVVDDIKIGRDGDDTAGSLDVDDRGLERTDYIALCTAGVVAQNVFGVEGTHKHAGAGDHVLMINALSDLSQVEAQEAAPDADDAFAIKQHRRCRNLRSKQLSEHASRGCGVKTTLHRIRPSP